MICLSSLGDIINILLYQNISQSQPGQGDVYALHLNKNSRFTDDFFDISKVSFNDIN